MNRIRQSIAIFGLITVLSGITPAVQAQPETTIIAVTSAEEAFNRGVIKQKNGDLQGAIEDYNQAIRLNPKEAAAYINRGNARDDLGDRQGAIADYNLAIRLNPKESKAYYNRGVTRAAMGDKQGAIADYNLAIRLNPDYANAYYNRGIEHLKLREKQAAIADIQKAADLYQQQGKTADYQEAINKIAKLQQQ